MTSLVVLVFALVYLGMLLGGLPFLQLDRTGVALLGAIALLAAGAVTPEQAAQAQHLPTLMLLFSFMVVSAQMRLGGFYGWVTRRVAALAVPPPLLLAALIVIVALLSAVFSNDIVCLAMAPVLADACLKRRLDPVPFLLALACAANVGSAATLIGNPQNMLIGSTLRLPFGAYALEAAVPVALSLLVTWLLIVWRVGARWTLEHAGSVGGEPVASTSSEERLDAWQTAKGLAIATGLVGLFLFAPWPREVAAITGAGLLLMSRKLHSHKMLGLVDWELLILFIGLFIVNSAFEQTGLFATAVRAAADAGLPLDHGASLFLAAFGLSNLVSNVPAVMLLMPLARGFQDGALLALVSTLAGNLLIVGSVANIIVVDAARRRGIYIDWKRHARVGVPVTVATLTVVAAYLALRMTPM